MVKWENLKEHDTTWRENGLKDLVYEIVGNVEGKEAIFGGDGILPGEENRVCRMTVDVKLNNNHWSNAKSGVDYIEQY